MRFDNRTALVMQKAARGPAAIALRQQRILFNPAIGVNRSSAVIQANLGGPHRMRGQIPTSGLGAVDPNAITSMAATKGVGLAATAGGTSLAATLGASAAVAGPIGLAVGAIAALVASQLFTRHYIDVAGMNAHEDSEVNIFNQYKQVMGNVPGRQLGSAAMRAIWKGAMHSGYWAKNNGKLCFHNGCSKYPGDASTIDAALDSANGNRNTFPALLSSFLAQAGAQGTQQNQGTFAVQPVVSRTAVSRYQLRGLGAINGTPEAKVFIDQYFVPANSPGTPCPGGVLCYWAAPSNPLEYQILYDMADAWLSDKGVAPTPYIANPQAVPPPPAVTIPQPAPISMPASGGPTITTSYPGFYMISTSGGYNNGALYITTADANSPARGQTVTTYSVVNGAMTAVGTLQLPAQANVGIPTQPGPGVVASGTPTTVSNSGPYTQGNTYPVQQPAQAATNWGPLIAIAAGLMTLR